MLKVIKDSETFWRRMRGNVSDNFCGFPKSTFPPYAITGQVCRVKEEVKVLTSLVQLSTRLWTPSKSNCLKMCTLILVDKQNPFIPHFLWRSLLTLMILKCRQHVVPATSFQAWPDPYMWLEHNQGRWHSLEITIARNQIQLPPWHESLKAKICLKQTSSYNVSSDYVISCLAIQQALWLKPKEYNHCGLSFFQRFFWNF